MGLKAVPPEDRPPVAIVHFAFQIMVACGMVLIITGVLGGWLAWKHKSLPTQRWYLRLVTFCAPLGFIAIEAGGRSRKSDDNRGLSIITCAQQKR